MKATLDVLFVLLLIPIESGNTLNNNPLLLLISFDGFRFDLLNETLVPNLWQFAQRGVNFVNGSRSQYLTYTAPNHVSIATGLVEQDHGIVANRFFDPTSNTVFDIFNETQQAGVVNASLTGNFYTGQPIWLTNELAGSSRRSASMFWPAGDAHWPMPPHQPTFTRSWNGYKTRAQWMADFDDVIRLFTRENDPMNFVAWYVEEPDHTLHRNGFYNGELRKTLHELDQLFAYAVASIERDEELAQRLNIIFTSDHGHAEINGLSNVFCISEHVDISKVQYGDNMLYVDDGQLRQKMFDDLQNAIREGLYDVNIYLKKDFPSRYGYAASKKVGDIILEPNVGSAIHPNCTSKGLKEKLAADNVSFHMSTHGMDPDNWMMRAALVMKGPAFKQAVKVKTIANNIDLYPLMCLVLGVSEARNNGSLRSVSFALLPSVAETLGEGYLTELPTVAVTIAFPLTALILFLIVLCCYRSADLFVDEKHSTSYRPLSSSSTPKFSMRTNGTREANLIAASSEDEL